MKGQSRKDEEETGAEKKVGRERRARKRAKAEEGEKNA